MVEKYLMDVKTQLVLPNTNLQRNDCAIMKYLLAARVTDGFPDKKN